MVGILFAIFFGWVVVDLTSAAPTAATEAAPLAAGLSPLAVLIGSIAVVIGGIGILKLHPFLTLLIAALFVGALTPQSRIDHMAQQDRDAGKITAVQAQKMMSQSRGDRLAQAFGNTCQQIGILVALASILGKTLLDSGGADRIVRTTLGFVGESRAGLGFLFNSFLLGIAVYFDTVFLLMIPLGKAMTLRTDRNYCLYLLSIAAGATMTHSLVPPTPGPLFVADQFGVPVGKMMLAGLLLGSVTAASGYLYAVWANRRFPVPLRPSADFSEEQMKQVLERSEDDLPPFWFSMIPILLPVILIGGHTILRSILDPHHAAWAASVLWIASGIGDKNVALLLAAGAGLLLLVTRPGMNRGHALKDLQEALSSGGSIILITAAGGAYGAALQQCGIGEVLESMAAQMSVSGLGILLFAFCVTTLLKTAQGSATVAMLTAATILKGFASAEVLGFDPIFLALAVGCGSKPFSWMNDSGFWVIGKIAGLTESETLKTFSTMLAVMGVVGIIVLIPVAALFRS